ncbi:uncharacterized protein LOC105433494 [Pogonomyrmex barbatus]|uniref:Uncharacterized protein LOC105433494 n=1 Tax=Pogonomyrmex barbatus TaxID=144034 RepID=A0A6I9XMD0_9HYME|nr:uncharacterized protein LOC105433494 [Pogonomyrmex barbatus]
MHYVKEIGISLVFVSEPYRTKGGTDWYVSTCEKSAILLFDVTGTPSVSRIKSGNGFTALKVNDHLMVSCYFSPNRPLEEFGGFLDDLYDLVRFYPMERVIVAGDFNARSTSWRDTITNDRGTLLERWLDSTGLVVANNNSRPTCERDQGKSIVDLIQVSARIRTKSILTSSRTNILDADVLCDPTSLANDFSHSLTWLLSRVCDLSMPRSRQVHIRRAYWWNEEIAKLCRLCIQTRRKLIRA